MALDGNTAFRALLHNYVLWCIGELDEDKQAKLEALAPRLAQTFGHSGSWQEIISVEMDFPPTMPDVVRGLWTNNLKRFRANGEEPDPNVFAQHVVEKNFLPDRQTGD